MELHKTKKELAKLEDQRFAQEFGATIKAQNEKHDSDIRKAQDKQRAILEGQAKTVIPDANEAKKRAAVDNMRKAYERAQTIANETEKRKQEDKKLELTETQKILKLQMDSKHAQHSSQQEHDKQL